MQEECDRAVCMNPRKIVKKEDGSIDYIQVCEDCMAREKERMFYFECVNL